MDNVVVLRPEADRALGKRSSIAREMMVRTLVDMLRVVEKHGVIDDHRSCALGMLRVYEQHVTDQARVAERKT